MVDEDLFTKNYKRAKFGVILMILMCLSISNRYRKTNSVNNIA